MRPNATMNFSKSEIERYLAKPDPAIAALLFFGPDQGLAHERAAAARRLVLGAGEDPFRLAEFSASEIAEDPARLADELNAIAMLGGRRVVMIQPAIDARHNEALADAVAALLPEHRGQESAFLIVEAGDLPAKHALVKAFAGSANAAAVRCYHDSSDDIRRMVAAALKAEGHSLAQDALDELASRLGDDRGVTRAEIEKLALYVGASPRRIERADVDAVIGDQSEIAIDDLVSALAEGDCAGLMRAFDRCLVDADPVQLLRAASRHFLRLHFILGQMRAGLDFESAASTLRPPVFWSMKSRIERQCRQWDERSCGQALQRLTDLEANVMRFHDIGATLARDGLLAIAAAAGRAGPNAPRRR